MDLNETWTNSEFEIEVIEDAVVDLRYNGSSIVQNNIEGNTTGKLNWKEVRFLIMGMMLLSYTL